MSLNEIIRASNDHSSRLVPCPEWGPGVEVLVKSLSAADRMALVKRTKAIDETEDSEMDKGQETINTMLLLACFDPESGGRLFSQEDVDTWLLEKNPEVLDRLVEVGLEVSGLGKDPVDAGKDGSSSTTPRTSTSST